MIGSIRFEVQVGVPGPPEDSDVLVEAEITDVLCQAGTTACTGGALTDYTGAMQMSSSLRRVDHWNAVAPGGGPDAATMVDIPFPIAMSCAPTSGSPDGSTCTTNSSFNAVQPGNIKDGKRTDLEFFGPWTVTDGGSDGVVGTTPNSLFAIQGIFVP